MHPEALNSKTETIWKKCAFLSDKDFYLAGGTALALQIGHRISVDLDFFSYTPIKKTLLLEIEEKFDLVVPIIKTKNELTVTVSDVKVTFLHYPFTLLSSKVQSNVVPLASVRDISSMKAYTLGRRQSLKDYIDLYEIFYKKIFTLEETLIDARIKYKEVFNDRLFLEQLLYIDDLENEPIQWIFDEVSKGEMRDFFKDEIGKLEL